MAALTVPAQPEKDASMRSLPWRRMAWVTWRQHRFALGGVTALLGVLALWLGLTGVQMHHAYASVAACHPASSSECMNLVSDFNSSYASTAELIAALLQAVPALIGAFVGAPVLARELETGTFRYAWTLAFGRWRWALAKLVPLAITMTAAAGVFSLLLSWYYQPFFADGNQTPLAPAVFDLRGVAFAAWTLAAFAIGAMAGMLIRRVVPAIAATLAVHVGLALAAGVFLRQHYLTPLATTQVNLPGSAWILGTWWTKNGKFAFAPWPPESLLFQICPPSVVGPGKGSPTAFMACVTSHGFREWTNYQPGSRFWPFQWIEGGWLLALAVLLIATTVWLVHRRAA